MIGRDDDGDRPPYSSSSITTLSRAIVHDVEQPRPDVRHEPATRSARRSSRPTRPESRPDTPCSRAIVWWSSPAARQYAVTWSSTVLINADRPPESMSTSTSNGGARRRPRRDRARTVRFPRSRRGSLSSGRRCRRSRPGVEPRRRRVRSWLAPLALRNLPVVRADLPERTGPDPSLPPGGGRRPGGDVDITVPPLATCGFAGREPRRAARRACPRPRAAQRACERGSRAARAYGPA